MIGPRHRGEGGTAQFPNQANVTPTPPSLGRTLLNGVVEVAIVLVMALVLSLVIKTFFVQAFRIPSQSMENTLLRGDRVIVSKLTPGPFELHRGDVIVFADPGGWLPAAPAKTETGLQAAVRKTLTYVGLLPTDADQHLIKRIIGLPGDTVACDDQDQLSVNGKVLQEPYVFPGDTACGEPFSKTVPADHLWMMGDHRSVSWDSRFHDDPFVPMDKVVGKAFLIVWPLSRLGGVTSAGSAFDGLP